MLLKLILIYYKYLDFKIYPQQKILILPRPWEEYFSKCYTKIYFPLGKYFIISFYVLSVKVKVPIHTLVR